MISIDFLITSLVVILIPGTGVIYTISTGLSRDRKSAIVAALGCTLSLIPHLIAGIIGVSAILYTGSLIFRFIKFAGILYLIYLGIGMIRESSKLIIPDEEGKTSLKEIAIKGVLINLLNPKLTLFFFSFLPQFINDRSPHFGQMIILGALFILLTFVIFIAYALLANYFKEIVLSSEKVSIRIQQGFGFIFIALATKLLLANE